MPRHLDAVLRGGPAPSGICLFPVVGSHARGLYLLVGGVFTINACAFDLVVHETHWPPVHLRPAGS